MDKFKTLIFLILLASVGWTPPLLAAGPDMIAKDTIPARHTPAKLVYVVEGDQKFLIPYIERKLKNLRRRNSDELLYDSVVSLNILSVTPTIEARLFDILSATYGGKLTPAFDTQRKQAQDTYTKYLRNFESVLSIKVTPLQDLVEFQFTLYAIIDSGNNLQYQNSSSVFIDPRSGHYQADVNRGLDQVFEEANKQPSFTITSNLAKYGNTYFLTSDDTLLLQPIVDDESVEEDRIYFWKQDTTDKVQAPVEGSKKNQFFKNLRPGRYHLHFKVSNGINYSNTESIRIYVYTKPLLRVSRPGDETLFKKFSERLIIQEYVFVPRQIDYFSAYTARLDTTRFRRPYPELFVKVYDKKGAVYADRSFRFLPPDNKIAVFNNDTSAIIDNIDDTETPIRTVRGNQYVISFVARDSAIESVEVKDDLNVYQRRPLSILYDVLIFPVDKSGLYHSWINAGVGLDLRLNKWLSAIAVVGTDLAKASFQHFYTNLIANIGPFKKLPAPLNKLEGGPALLINHDNNDVSTGFKITYTFYSGNHTNLKIGGSYYNQGDIDYFGIHFTGDIFFNH
jgi:hypothetical protein